MAQLESIYRRLERYQEHIYLNANLDPATNFSKKTYYITCELEGNAEELQKRDDTCSLFFVCENLDEEEFFLKIVLLPLGGVEANMSEKVRLLCNSKTPNLIDVVKTRSIEYTKHQIDFVLMKYEENFINSMKVIIKELPSDDEFFPLAETIIFQISHGLGVMHANFLQHRDIKKQNLCIGESETNHIQYVIDDVKFRIPVRFENHSCVVKITDFGLSCDKLNPFAEDDALNNTDPSLSPDFVFFDHGRDLEYQNVDEIFSAGMCIVSAITGFRMTENMDRGIRREIIGLFEFQKENGTPTVKTHLKTRNLAFVAYQAFRLVLLLGYPTKREMPMFYRSIVGKAILAMKPYLESLENYDYLRKQLDDSHIYVKALKKMLRWNRSDRVESFKDLLMSDLFQHYRIETLDPDLPIYHNSKFS